MQYRTGPAAFADGEWPQEMLISVDYPENLLTLLFIRQSWQLETMSQLPELLLAPQPGTSAAPSSASLEEWSHRWDRAWGQAWEWYGIERHRELFASISSDTFRDIVENGYAPNPLVSPQWTFDFGDEGLDRDAFYAWSAPLRREQEIELAAEPERISLPSLRTAWSGGLDSIIVLPFAENWARRLDKRHLAVSTTTRNTASSYSDALSLPIPNN